MSTTTDTSARTGTRRGNWAAGAVGGVVGAIVMGGLMIAMNEAVIAVAIPSLYTLAPPPSLPMGMGVHIFHGLFLGLVFAGVVAAIDLDSPLSKVGAGVVWGVLTWALLAALLMPVWLDAVGSPANPPFPNFAMPSLLWHVVFGLVLGAVYVASEDVF